MVTWIFKTGAAFPVITPRSRSELGPKDRGGRRSARETGTRPGSFNQNLASPPKPAPFPGRHPQGRRPLADSPPGQSRARPPFPPFNPGRSAGKSLAAKDRPPGHLRGGFLRLHRHPPPHGRSQGHRPGPPGRSLPKKGPGGSHHLNYGRKAELLLPPTNSPGPGWPPGRGPPPAASSSSIPTGEPTTTTSSPGTWPNASGRPALAWKTCGWAAWRPGWEKTSVFWGRPSAAG